MRKWTHVGRDGRASMVDVSSKSVTLREAVASGEVVVGKKILSLIRANKISKGEVLAAARIAGIGAAKRTDELIPLCHTLKLSAVEISFDLLKDRVKIWSRVKANEKTGVEMEALTAVSVAALTIYDMCKSLDKGIVIGPVILEQKSGGKSGTYVRRVR